MAVRVAAQTNARSACRHCRVTFSPASAAARSKATVPMRAQGKTGPRRPSGCSSQAVIRSSMSPGSASISSLPPGASSCVQRCSSPAGMPPMPMFPSASRTVAHRPWPGSGSNTERCRAGAPAWRTRDTAAREMSTPSAGIPRSVSAMVSRPGPQPTSRTGPRQCLSSSSSAASGRPHHRETCSGSARPSAVRKISGAACPFSASSYKAIASALMPSPRGCLPPSRRPVGGAVVDDDRAEASGHPLKNPGQSRRLVQARQDHVYDHGCDAITNGRPT
jgi:hypothetical protein